MKLKKGTDEYENLKIFVEELFQAHLGSYYDDFKLSSVTSYGGNPTISNGIGCSASYRFPVIENLVINYSSYITEDYPIPILQVIITKIGPNWSKIRSDRLTYFNPSLSVVLPLTNPKGPEIVQKTVKLYLAHQRVARPIFSKYPVNIDWERNSYVNHQHEYKRLFSDYGLNIR